jgi:hypothetical protein
MKTSHFFIGPGRSGTTWLYDALNKTGQVQKSRIKEPAYFDTHFAKGEAWYDHLYVDLPDGQTPMARTDFSNLYYLDRIALQRLSAYNPNAWVVFIDRPHLDLFRSMLYFELRKGKTLDQIRHLAPQKYQDSDCQQHIAGLREMFGDRLVVLDFQWIVDKNLSLIYERIHLPGLKRVDSQQYNARMVPRALWMARLVKKVALLLRRHEWFGLLQTLKQSGWVRRAFFIEGEALAKVPSIEELIRRFFPEKS